MIDELDPSGEGEAAPESVIVDRDSSDARLVDVCRSVRRSCRRKWYRPFGVVDADDIAQDVFIRLIKIRNTHLGGNHDIHPSLINAVICRVVIDSIRHERSRRQITKNCVSIDSMTNLVDRHRSFEDLQTREIIEVTMMCLQPDQQNVLRMIADGFSRRDTARCVGRSLRTINRYMKHIKSLMASLG